MPTILTPGGSAGFERSVNPELSRVEAQGLFRSEICAHVEAHVGPIARVLHENQSQYVHLDVLVIPPSTRFPFTTLVTSGMSDRPMLAPYDEEEARNWARCEFVIGLPADWNGGSVDTWTDETFGPVAELLGAARYPHACESWIAPGHTIAPSGNGMLGSWTQKFSSVLVDWPYALPPELGRLQVSENEAINFYGLYFITP